MKDSIHNLKAISWLDVKIILSPQGQDDIQLCTVSSFKLYNKPFALHLELGVGEAARIRELVGDRPFYVAVELRNLEQTVPGCVLQESYICGDAGPGPVTEHWWVAKANP